MSANLPSGTVTFLFTDIEGSTPLWEREPGRMRLALAQHDTILRQAVADQHGQVYKVIGDAIQAAFALPAEALAAALAAQRELAAVSWPTSVPLRVRMGLHTGPAEAAAADYTTTHTLNRVARIMAAAHGGQTVLSSETAELMRGDLPAGVRLLDLGQHRMKGMTRREHLFQLNAPDLPGQFPALATLDAVPNNLPVQLTSFIGRAQELAEIRELLTPTPALSRHPSPSPKRELPRSGEGEGPGVGVRLLTLTGSGGTGKTRLSLQVAADLLPQFPDGAWLVELAPLADPAQVPVTVAATLGMQLLPGAPLLDSLADYLRARQALLVLDNCEHLIAACAQFANHLLRQCPRIRFLASSREALGIAGETTYHVPSLGVPDERCDTLPALLQFDAARLFVERAQAAQPRFAPTTHNLGVIVQICHRLDGIPLAIELAAARVKLLSVEQIAVRLDDRFRLLTGGSRAALPRQQTLRALIDWSYDLLSEPERALLRRLSVFVGGWTLEAAEAVGEEKDEGGRMKDELIHPSSFRLHPLDFLDLLSQLVNKSLVVVDDDPEQMARRYRLLETIRQYARDRLLDVERGEAAAARDRHLTYFAHLSDEAEPGLRGPDAPDWSSRLTRELDNVRAALNWGLERHPEDALTIMGNLMYFWPIVLTSIAEREWLLGALAQTVALPAVEGAADQRRRTRGLMTAGVLLSITNPAFNERTYGMAVEAVHLARQLDDPVLLAHALSVQVTALQYGDAALARAIAEEVVALARRQHDTYLLASSLGALAWVASRQGDDPARQAAIAEVRRLVGRAGYVHRGAPILIQLALAARMRGDLAQARADLEDAVRVYGQVHDTLSELIAQSELAHLLRQTGQLGPAQDVYRQTIPKWRDMGHRSAVANQLESFGFIAIAQAQPRRAARLLGAAEALREVVGTPMLDEERVEYDGQVAALRAALEQARLDEAWAAGRALSIDQAIEYTLHET